MMKHSILFVLLFFSLIGIANANTLSDSLNLKDFKRYYAEKDFSKKAELLEGLLNIGLEESEYDLFQAEVEKIIDHATKKEDAFLLNYGRYLYSYVFINTAKFEQGAELTNSALSYFMENKNAKLLGFLFRDKGIINEGLSKYHISLTNFKKSQHFFKEANLPSEYMHSRALEAKLLIYFKEYDEAKNILKGCIHYMVKAKKYKTVFGYYNFLSDLYGEIDDDEMEKHCNLKSAEYAQKSGKLSTIALSKNNLAIAKFYEQDIEGALEYFHEALETRLKMNKMKLVCESYFNIATVYSETGQFDKAREYFLKSLEIAKMNDLPQEEADAYLALTEVYEHSKKYSDALIVNKKYLKVKERLFLEGMKEAKNQSMKLAKLDTDARQTEISNFVRNQSQGRSIQNYICVVLGLGYVVLFGFFIQKKRRASKVSLP